MNLIFLGGSTVRSACTVRVLVLFHRPTHLPDGEVHVFPSCTSMIIVHTALCPLLLSTMSLSWLPAGITVTYTQSNGDRVLVTVISVPKCGQYVSIEYDAKGHSLSHPMAPAHRIEVISKKIRLTTSKQRMLPETATNQLSWVMVHKAQAISRNRAEQYE